MANIQQEIWLVAGVRTPFVGVDGPFAHRDLLALSVPVVQGDGATDEGKDRFRRMGGGDG